MSSVVNYVLIDLDEVETKLPMEELEGALSELVRSPLSHRARIFLVTERLTPTRWQRFTGRHHRRTRQHVNITFHGGTSTLTFVDEQGSLYVAGPTSASVELFASVLREQAFPPLPIFNSVEAIAGVMEFARTGSRPSRFSYHSRR